MAISRAQLLKELLPGLNALFGLEYAKYGEEHEWMLDFGEGFCTYKPMVDLGELNALPNSVTSKPHLVLTGCGKVAHYARNKINLP